MYHFFNKLIFYGVSNSSKQKKLQGKRHIVTPEQGMFIGPDQSERDKQFREKNRKNQQALEEVHVYETS